MAAAVSYRSTRGLCLILSLLSLIYFANALLDMDQVVKLKESIKKVEQKIASVKADYQSDMSANSEVMTGYKQFMGSVMQMLGRLAPEFEPLQEFLPQFSVFVQRVQTHIDREGEDLMANLEETQQKVENLKKVLKILETNDEL